MVLGPQNGFSILLFIVPLYVANASAMLIGKFFPSKPVDNGWKWLDRRPILGRGKTWSGGIGGIVCGSLAGILLYTAWNIPAFETLLGVPYPNAAVIISVGAIFGDMAGSFLKRRINLKPGHPSPVLDQLDFVVGGYVFLAYWYHPPFEELLVVALLTVVVHVASNFIAYKMGIKKVPW